MTHRSEQRRERRVAYSGFVRLRGLGEEESVEAEIRNLSALGMFVATKKVPRPGAAVFCRVILGNDRRIIKGKVKWVAPGEALDQTGAGIEFVDLSKKDSEVLRTVLDANLAGPPPEKTTPMDSDGLGHVEVEFEGLQTPVRARARVTADGIVLTTKLPFLRVGSDVNVKFSPRPGEAATRGGRLQAVSLGNTGADGVPRLLVELETRAPGQGADAGARAEAGPTPRLEVDTEPQVATLPLASSRAPQPFGEDAFAEPDEDITPTVVAFSIPGEDVFEVDVESAPRVTLTPEAEEEPLATLDLLPEQALLAPPPRPMASIELDLTPLPDPAPQVAPLPSGLVLPPAEVSEPTLRVADGHEFSLPYETRVEDAAGGLPWKMIVGAAVAAAAVAFLAVGADEPEVAAPPAPAVQAEPVASHTGIRIEPLPAPSPTPPALAAVPKPAFKPVKRAPIAAEPSPSEEREWAPIGDPSWPFTVVAEAETTTVFIPLGGTLASGRVYALAKPAGVGAMFPDGQLTKTSGRFSVNEAGITQVWAEPRETGLHVRVLFGRNVVSHVAKLEPDGLRVEAIRR